MKLFHLMIILVAFQAYSVMGGGGGGLLGSLGDLLDQLLNRKNPYTNSCPDVKEIVRTITWKRTSANPALPAKLLRLHFHDCFVEGCDGSVLLDSTKGNSAEKDAIPNQSLSGFDVIDEIKRVLEEKCPETVSCADILALAARDAVSFQYKKPWWNVPIGRKDGRISKASEALANLPSPFSNFSTLKQSYASKGLTVRDLVALSGGHTIGVGHCNFFSNRLYNFTGKAMKGDRDPSLDPYYATKLEEQCPNLTSTTEVGMDDTPKKFDENYFIAVKDRKGMFQSDAALITDPEAREYVLRFSNPDVFNREFASSMERMGAIGILTGNKGEIRKNCRVINSY